MCIRNACETNERIRHFIESLQLQDAVVVNEKLKESGMQVEVDSKTGKLKFVPPTA
jgi:calcineurin-like phosphoesterase